MSTARDADAGTSRGNPETDAGGEGSIDKKASLNKDKDDVVKDKQRGEGK